MNEPFGSVNPYTEFVRYVTCPFCSGIVDRRVNYWNLYDSESCQRAFRSGLHERVNELFGQSSV